MNRPIRRALLSVWDKSGLADFARPLAEMGVSLISTGGTAKALRSEGLAVTELSELTGSPEILDGRVKSLHPFVHAALLAKPNDAAHQDALRRLGIAQIDLLVVNLYPFEAAVGSGAPLDDCLENIDIGGPAMIRAGAKNYHAVAVVTDPDDYSALLAEMRSGSGCLSEKTRMCLAAKAFSRTAAYDAAISSWFLEHTGGELPPYFAVGGRRLSPLRYGENPHQQAAFYSAADDTSGNLVVRQVQGRELSYNNINDADAAWQCVNEFADRSVCVIVKHANPSGVACADRPAEAYRRALLCDPVSAYGGIIAFNQALDEEAAAEIVKLFAEVVIAPAASDAARNILSRKQNLRLLLVPPAAMSPGRFSVKTAGGGLLVQSVDDRLFDETGLKVVTKRAPSTAELADLIFAFTVAKHVKSNAIVYARNLATVGIGAGQMSRLDSSRIAARKAEEAAKAAGLDQSLAHGSVVASDAFFPFADGLLAAAEAGATAVIQPGGSMRDDEIIAAADEAGLAMVFTGTRHFLH
ncbi:MAG: bifunctional phosphoribosylaminoimidazolecarboxamide formyltransferase/IMP cyclohydrolase [Aestuariivirgaceae bacterium]